MIFRRRHIEPDYRWWTLANYNAERARGIVHTAEWQERMRLEQDAFDREQRRMVNLGPPPPPPIDIEPAERY
jgi:hypothetical protein